MRKPINIWRNQEGWWNGTCFYDEHNSIANRRGASGIASAAAYGFFPTNFSSGEVHSWFFHIGYPSWYDVARRLDLHWVLWHADGS